MTLHGSISDAEYMTKVKTKVVKMQTLKCKILYKNSSSIYIAITQLNTETRE